MTTDDQSWRGDTALGVQAWLAGAGALDAVDSQTSAASRSGPVPDYEAAGRKILLDQLTGRARSRAELADKLHSRGIPDDVATDLLDRFTELGLVDDAAFARDWVEARAAGRGLAGRALAVELRRKGIDDGVVAAAIAEIDPSTQREVAVALVRRKLRSMDRLEDTVKARRLVGMLARKGYSSGESWGIVRDVLGESMPESDM